MSYEINGKMGTFNVQWQYLVKIVSANIVINVHIIQFDVQWKYFRFVDKDYQFILRTATIKKQTELYCTEKQRYTSSLQNSNLKRVISPFQIYL